MSTSMSSIDSILEMSSVPLTQGIEPCKDQRVTNKEANDRSKLELNFLDCFEKRSVEASDLQTNGGKKEAKKRTYYCKFCNSKFSSLQALGGHQNAHKRERALAKNLMNAAAASKEIGSLLYPYSRMAMKPYGFLNKTFGVQTQSMIHKPYSHYLNSVLGHDYQDWPRTNMIQPASMHQTRDSGFQGLGMSGLSSGFKPVEMSSLNSANQHVADMVTRGNYKKGTFSSQNQENETPEVDLSLKL